MMFEREHHRKILTVLNSLNANFLADCGAYFGGGTLISLRHGEYRLSEDIDFMCSFDEKYAKLLANTDRWPDQRKKSRDIIDLSVQRFADPFPEEAIAKAESVYSAIKHLKKSIQHFQENPDYRQECFEVLDVRDPAKIVDGLDLLASDMGMEATERTFIEYKRD